MSNMDPTIKKDEQHGPPKEMSNMDPTTKRDEQHGPHHQKRRATWTPPPKKTRVNPVAREVSI